MDIHQVKEVRGTVGVEGAREVGEALRAPDVVGEESPEAHIFVGETDGRCS